jgi:hypothetical protein
MGGTITRDEWLKLGGPEEPEPDRVCLGCNKPLGVWMITYPADPGERGVLCVMCWRDRLGFKRFSFNPTSSGAGASR